MLDILFVSDYVCPYCLVAKEALRRALTEEGVEARFTWHPFELTEEPRPRVDTFHDEVRRAHYQVLAGPCRQLGLDMKLPPRVVPRPYTRLAFEGWLYACDMGLGDVYNDEIYHAYFIEEQDIGDPAVLAAVAARLGLDAAGFAAALAEKRYTAAEKAAVTHARDILQIKAVPTIYFDGTRVEPTGYSVEAMCRLLQEYLQRQAQQPEAAAPAAFGCSEDGCGEPEPAVAGCSENGCG